MVNAEKLDYAEIPIVDHHVGLGKPGRQGSCATLLDIVSLQLYACHLVAWHGLACVNVFELQATASAALTMLTLLRKHAQGVAGPGTVVKRIQGFSNKLHSFKVVEHLPCDVVARSG